VITRQIPSLARDGTWNVIDFPPPVGISPRVSLPSAIDLMISSWSGLKEEFCKDLFVGFEIHNAAKVLFTKIVTVFQFFIALNRLNVLGVTNFS
jgi:hypothetical protein